MRVLVPCSTIPPLSLCPGEDKPDERLLQGASKVSIPVLSGALRFTQADNEGSSKQLTAALLPFCCGKNESCSSPLTSCSPRHIKSGPRGTLRLAWEGSEGSPGPGPPTTLAGWRRERGSA